jgi:hypothetical protein
MLFIAFLSVSGSVSVSKEQITIDTDSDPVTDTEWFRFILFSFIGVILFPDPDRLP